MIGDLKTATTKTYGKNKTKKCSRHRFKRPVQYRENPRTNEKIDAWIKANPDQFKFFDELPHERAVRKLVLNEVQKYERMQKMNSGIVQKLDNDPEAKQAFETLLKRVARRPARTGDGFNCQTRFSPYQSARRKCQNPKCRGREDGWRIRICAGQRLAAFTTAWRSGSPFQRRTPRPAC